MWPALVAALLVLATQSEPAVPSAADVQRIVLTVPRDEWRLTITRDGASRINYAALPQTAETPPGSIPFSDVHATLRARLTAACADERPGSVEFVTAGTTITRSWCAANDRDAAALFDQSWAAVPPPVDPVDREHVDLLRSMWSGRRAPR